MNRPPSAGDLVEYTIEGGTHRTTVWSSAPDGHTYIHAIRDPRHVITVPETDLTIVRRFGAEEDEPEPVDGDLELDLFAGGEA